MKTVEVRGMTFPSLKAAAEHFRVEYGTVRTRLRRGVPLDEALGMAPIQTFADCPRCKAVYVQPGECLGCLDLEKLGAEPHPTLTPRCLLCQRQMAPDGTQMRWGRLYSGIETALTPAPVCVDCTPFITESLRDFYCAVAKVTLWSPTRAEEVCVEQHHTCYVCEKPFDQDEVRLLDTRRLVHPACALEQN